MSDVRDNPAAHRFELAIDGSPEVAGAYYSMDGDRLTLTHTIVPPQFEGQGVGSRLAKGVFDILRAKGRKAVLRCPFMAAYYERHPDYADIVERPAE